MGRARVRGAPPAGYTRHLGDQDAEEGRGDSFAAGAAGAGGGGGAAMCGRIAARVAVGRWSICSRRSRFSRYSTTPSSSSWGARSRVCCVRRDARPPRWRACRAARAGAVGRRRKPLCSAPSPRAPRRRADVKYLYMVLEYIVGGEFFTHLRKARARAGWRARSVCVRGPNGGCAGAAGGPVRRQDVHFLLRPDRDDI